MAWNWKRFIQILVSVLVLRRFRLYCGIISRGLLSYAHPRRSYWHELLQTSLICRLKKNTETGYCHGIPFMNSRNIIFVITSTKSVPEGSLWRWINAKGRTYFLNSITSNLYRKKHVYDNKESIHWSKEKLRKTTNRSKERQTAHFFIRKTDNILV